MRLFIVWIFLMFLVIFSCLLITRRFWILYNPIRLFKRKKTYLPLHSSFQTDLEAGFSSNTFDIYQNIQSNDPRAGLDSLAKKEIHDIMNQQNCNFDEARVIYNKTRMEYHSIDPKTGKPIDPRAVFFS